MKIVISPQRADLPVAVLLALTGVALIIVFSSQALLKNLSSSYALVMVAAGVCVCAIVFRSSRRTSRALCNLKRQVTAMPTDTIKRCVRESRWLSDRDLARKVAECQRASGEISPLLVVRGIVPGLNWLTGSPNPWEPECEPCRRSLVPAVVWVVALATGYWLLRLAGLPFTQYVMGPVIKWAAVASVALWGIYWIATAGSRFWYCPGLVAVSRHSIVGGHTVRQYPLTSGTVAVLNLAVLESRSWGLICGRRSQLTVFRDGVSDTIPLHGDVHRVAEALLSPVKTDPVLMAQAVSAE